MLKDDFHKLSTEYSIAVNEKLGFADIGLDCDECQNSADSDSKAADPATSEPRPIAESHQFGEISLHDMIVIEIVDRGSCRSTKHEHDQPTETPVKGSSSVSDASAPIPETPPKEMELFKAEFSLERSTLLRSPYFAKLLCGSCKTARKLQLNLRDHHTNIEALIAASFFLDSGTQVRIFHSLPCYFCSCCSEFSVFEAVYCALAWLMHHMRQKARM
jgi:hypothetical protein